MESGVEREILRIERELEQIKLDVRTLTTFRQSSLEQQLAALWYNPVSGCSGVIVLTSSPTTWIAGTNSFTATLSGNCGVPTGTVSFYLDGVLQGSAVTISGGVASKSFTITSGTHTVLAVYSGDFTYSSGQASLTQTISSAGINFGACTLVPTTLFCRDSRYFPVTAETMNYDVGSNTFIGVGVNITVFGHSTCISHVLSDLGGGFCQINTYWVDGGGGFPATNTCPQTYTKNFRWNQTSRVCVPHFDFSFAPNTSNSDYTFLSYNSGTDSIEIKTS